MGESRELGARLSELDGRGYGGYKALRGEWRFDDFTLVIDRVQGDPFASPSRVRALVSGKAVGLAPEAFESPERRVGTAAYLARHFARSASNASRRMGNGRGGEIRMVDPGQVVHEQSALRVSDGGAVEARFTVGLPARGRRIAGKDAQLLLLETLPRLVAETLVGDALDHSAIESAAATNEDAEALRASLHARGLVAFVADGASLPRASGESDRPLDDGNVVPFASPPELAITLDAPNHGAIRGMGVPEGITVIVGGGFHGKSTLLRALQAGVWNHAPGDGRERVVTDRSATTVRAEDGRSVAGVDISPFIDGLPLGIETHRFTTTNASGSTSQAASIVEALEAGTRLLVMDEDTSASNFMSRDRLMRSLVPAAEEPITPWSERVRDVHEQLGISAILVAGGTGAFLQHADRVIRMKDFRALDVTNDARSLTHPAAPSATARSPSSAEGLNDLTTPPFRRIDVASLSPARGRRAKRIRVRSRSTLEVGESTIDLSSVEQLVSAAQLRALGEVIAWLHDRYAGQVVPLGELLDDVDRARDTEGLAAFNLERTGDLATFRRQDLSSVLNRIRALRVE